VSNVRTPAIIGEKCAFSGYFTGWFSLDHVPWNSTLYFFSPEQSRARTPLLAATKSARSKEMADILDL
jgi:hypothetical protein